MPIKVSIVEDDAGVREGLKRLIERSPDFEFLALYTSAEVALKELAQHLPDVLLMDIHLPGMNGVECVRQLHLLHPTLRVVMLTVFENPDQIFKALSAGAIGYLLKHTPPAELLSAIRDAYQGGAPMNSQIARKVVQFFQASAPTGDAEKLSAREIEVLNLLAKGFLIKEISDQLGISFSTARTYVRRIYETLHVHSRSQATAKFLNPPTLHR